MPIIDNISCSIHTDSGPLEEFPCVEGGLVNGKISTVYIPAKDGEHFSINCAFLTPSQHLQTNPISITPSIDGVKEHGIVAKLEAPKVIFEGSEVMNPNRTWKVCKFMFSSVNLTEDDIANTLTLEKVNSLGEIKVVLRRYQATGGVGGAPASSSNTGKGRTIIHEKTVKGRDISHSVGRGEEKSISAPTILPGIYLDTEQSPYMTFRFLYKSERALKNMGLLERSPSPPPNLQIECSPSPAKSNLVKSETKNNHRNLKRERVDSPGSSSVPGQAKAPRMELDEIETIDLTGDD